VAQAFLWAKCFSCYPTNSVSTPKEAHSADPNQEKSSYPILHHTAG